jgi:hypothetical protein
MALCKATVTCANIEKQSRWLKLYNPISKGAIGDKGITKLGVASQFSVQTAKSGMLLLGGLIYEKADAHITVTPNGVGEWTYFHLTVAGGKGGSAYYALDIGDEDGELSVVQTRDTYLTEQKKTIQVNKAKRWAAPNEVAADLKAIMHGLLPKEADFAEGEAAD